MATLQDYQAAIHDIAVDTGKQEALVARAKELGFLDEDEGLTVDGMLMLAELFLQAPPLITAAMALSKLGA